MTSIRLIESNIDISRIINDAVVKKLDASFNSSSNINFIKTIVKSFVIKVIKNSDIYRDILYSNIGLTAHLGIPKDRKKSMLDNLLEAWGEQIVCEPLGSSKSAAGQKFQYRYRFGAIESDWSKILAHPDAKYPNESRRARLGEAPATIPFLEWLLVAGDQLKIEGFQISAIEEGSRPTARSGAAIMIKADGASWQIPTNYGSNAPDNNFVTRAIDIAVENDNKFKESLIGILRKIGKMKEASIDKFAGINIEDLF